MTMRGCLQILCLIFCIKAADILKGSYSGQIAKPYTFTCYTSDSGNGTVTWSMNTQHIATCDQSKCQTVNVHLYMASVSGRMTSLTIRNVTIHDRGVYSCSDGFHNFIYNFTVPEPTFKQENASVLNVGALVGGLAAALIVIWVAGLTILWCLR